MSPQRSPGRPAQIDDDELIRRRNNLVRISRFGGRTLHGSLGRGSSDVRPHVKNLGFYSGHLAGAATIPQFSTLCVPLTGQHLVKKYAQPEMPTKTRLSGFRMLTRSTRKLFNYSPGS